jgi:hypothetical protein
MKCQYVFIKKQDDICVYSELKVLQLLCYWQLKKTYSCNTAVIHFL